jgi:hypothetical protein
MSAFITRHGHAGSASSPASPTYRAWQSAIQRCTNPNHPSWKDYGGRGITVCARWRSFEAFLADMGERPAARLSLDRWPNNDGGYAPGNCRWATQSEQLRNRRKVKQSPEHVEKRAAAKRGKPLSAEAIAKRPATRRARGGYVLSAKQRNALREANARRYAGAVR